MRTQRVVCPPESRALKSGRIVLMPGEEAGEHATHKREELIIVLKGKATVIAEGKSLRVGEGETHYIKEGVMHNVKNLSGRPLEYVYIVSLFA